jgi:hypothetical protein
MAHRQNVSEMLAEVLQFVHEQEANMLHNTVERKLMRNEPCTRIEQLIANRLVQIADRNHGWTILYQDPIDLTYWELIYPDGEIYGSGPFILTQVSIEKVRTKYHFLD